MKYTKRKDGSADFIDSYVFRLERTSANHLIITNNIFAILRNFLKGKPCKALGDPVALKVSSGLPQPDIFITCENVSQKKSIFTDAVLIVEVLSGNRAKDFGNKFETYKELPSFSEYFLIEQDKKLIWFYRKQEDGSWSDKDFYSFNSDVEFQSIGLTLTLDQIYEDVEF